MNYWNMTGAAVLLILVLAILTQTGCAMPPEVKAVNNNPVIENILFPKEIAAKIEAQIQCAATDADGDALAYEWSADAGEIKGEGYSVLWFPPDKLGTYTLALAVKDGKGGETRGTFNIRVLTNEDGTASPAIDIKLKLGTDETVVIDKQRARVWTTTNITCFVEGVKSDELTYSWSANGGRIMGKEVQQGKADRIGWIAPGNASDFTIEVVVKDKNGSQARGQVNMQVFCCGN